MKLLLVLLTGFGLLANITSAQDFSSLFANLPPCILPCFEKGVAEYNCSSTTCVCTSAPLQTELLRCIESTCSAADQVLAAGVGSMVCAGVPIPSKSIEVRNDVIILAAVTYPIVAMRYWQRWTIARQIWFDDWMALITTVLLLAFDGIAIASASKGFGAHIWGIESKNLLPLSKLFWVLELFYISVQVFTKLSICYLYIRIFPRTFFQNITKGIMLLLIAHLVAFTSAAIFQCTPVKAVWDRSIQGKCISLEAFGYSAAAASILEDLVILALPVSELKNLNLGTKKKVALAFMFSLGSFACVTSIIRLKYIGKIARSLDSTYDNVDPVVWSIIEVHTALICACLPSLKSLLTKYFPVLFKSTLASSSTNKNNTGTVSQKVFSKHHSRRRMSDSYVWLPESSGASTNNISAGGVAALGVVADEEKDIPLRVMERDGRDVEREEEGR